MYWLKPSMRMGVFSRPRVRACIAGMQARRVCVCVCVRAPGAWCAAGASSLSSSPGALAPLPPALPLGLNGWSHTWMVPSSGRCAWWRLQPVGWSVLSVPRIQWTVLVHRKHVGVPLWLWAWLKPAGAVEAERMAAR
jgi:hypothetical protein